MTRLPESDPTILARRSEIIDRLRRIAPADSLITSEAELRAYECDGLTAYRQIPLAVFLPENTDQLRQALAECHDLGVKFVPRGAGTSLSGGAMPLADGVVIGMARFNRILDIDFDNRCVVTQPGVTNLAITEAVEGRGFYYAPDPSSPIVCPSGGNGAETSGEIGRASGRDRGGLGG